MLVRDAPCPDDSARRQFSWADEIVCDDSGKAAAQLGAVAFPTAFLWDREGRVLVDRKRVHAVQAALQSAPR
jgi:hypothetical protein